MNHRQRLSERILHPPAHVSRFTMVLANLKIRYQRALGYVTLATFLLVFYTFARSIYDSPTFEGVFPEKPNFIAFVIFMFFLSIAAILFVGQLDWKYLFKAEQGQHQVANPLLITGSWQNAYLIAAAEAKGADVSGIIEETRIGFASCGYEAEFLKQLEIARSAFRGDE